MCFSIINLMIKLLLDHNNYNAFFIKTVSISVGKERVYYFESTINVSG